MRQLMRMVLSRPIVLASMRVSLVVGTLLNVVNQGAAIVNGEDISWVHLLLNYLVPYCVASYSGAAARLRQGVDP